MLIIALYALSVTFSKCWVSANSPVKSVSAPDMQERQAPHAARSAANRNSEKIPDVYSLVEHHARNVKAILQMMIGVAAVCVVGWRFLEVPIYSTHQATALLIDGIGVGLAAAAALELAYTLFTSGPDEALDPLMLALAAALLVQIARIEQTPSLGTVSALLLQGLLLALLFGARLMLVERSENDPDPPNVWWIIKTLDRRREKR